MTLEELSRKDVIQVPAGEKLGRVDDLRFDRETARVDGLILHGRPRLFGLMGRDPDMVIPWDKVSSIGLDVILTSTTAEENGELRRHRR